MELKIPRFALRRSVQLILLFLLMVGLVFVVHLGRSHYADYLWARRYTPLFQVSNAIESGDYGAAAAGLDMLSRTHNRFHEFWMLRGDVQTFNEDFPHAAESYTKALSLLADMHEEELRQFILDRNSVEVKLSFVGNGETWVPHLWQELDSLREFARLEADDDPTSH